MNVDRLYGCIEATGEQPDVRGPAIAAASWNSRGGEGQAPSGDVGGHSAADGQAGPGPMRVAEERPRNTECLLRLQRMQKRHDRIDRLDRHPCSPLSPLVIPAYRRDGRSMVSIS